MGIKALNQKEFFQLVKLTDEGVLCCVLVDKVGTPSNKINAYGYYKNLLITEEGYIIITV